MVYLNGRKEFVEYFFERTIKKKILLSFMMVCMSIFAFGVLNASAEQYGDYLYYTVSDDEVIITGCDNSATTIEIPSTIEEMPVTRIYNGAFEYCSSLTSITIPNSLTSIGWDAFSGCSSLTSIIIPDSVTIIDRYAFYGCSSLTSITIPDGVTSISENAFRDCKNLRNINVNANNVKYCSENEILYSADRTKIIIYPEGRPEENFTIPDGVTDIGYYAFYGCSSLTSITIPDSVTRIGERAFGNCKNLRNINVNANNVEYCSENGILYNVDRTEIIKYPGGRTETYFIIPDSVTSVGEYAFGSCSCLTSIIIPDGVTIIGDSTFYDCSSLTSIIISDNVTSIGWDAFSGCSSLTSIMIPDSVTSIGGSAFYRCSNLENITIPSGVTSIGEGTFYDCSNLRSITIPNSVTYIGDFAFKGCISLLDVYYEGTQDEWNNIDIRNYENDYLNSATIHCKASLAGTKTTVSDDEKTFDIKPANTVIGSTVVLALYNNGKLVEMKSEKYNSTDISFTTDKSYTSAKVMVWESLENMKPVCDAEIVK